MLGCGTTSTSDFMPGTQGAAYDAGSSGGSPPGTFAVSDAAPANGCSEAAKLVYVISLENDLYSFRPDKKLFTKIGTLNCPGTSGAPNSMAIDRSGTAWVNYSDGEFYKVSTVDASCAATSYQTQLGWKRFGMGFSSNSAGSQDETLYIVGLSDTEQDVGKGMGSLDLATMKLRLVGQFTGALKSKGAELTGTGDGKLFGFFATKPASFGEITKASAATPSSRELASMRIGSAWAFSFWGGDFWFYTADAPAPSKVTRLRASSDNALEVVMEDIGFAIVGAGVSTCAPITPPK
jgi:hypothetical protein